MEELPYNIRLSLYQDDTLLREKIITRSNSKEFLDAVFQIFMNRLEGRDDLYSEDDE